MRLAVKKAGRSLQVAVPKLQEARFGAQRRALRLFGRTWRPDAAALRYFSVDKPVILDVGANRGLSISSFLMLKPDASIIAFEPLAKFASALGARYRTVPNVTIHSCALGSADAWMTLYIPVYRGYMFDPLASLDHAEAAGWINAERVYWFDPKRLRIEEERVEVRRLDDFEVEPHIIKIIAQGHEPLVIQGGTHTIRRCEPAILAPARSPSIDACLRELGYNRYAFKKSMLYLQGEGHTSSWYLKPKHLDMFRCPVEL